MSDIRDKIIGAMLECIDDNMRAKHMADVERMADDALAAVAPLIQAAERERCAEKKLRDADAAELIKRAVDAQPFI